MAVRGSDLTEFKKGQINALKFYANFSKSEIAQSLGISVNTIKKYLQRSVIEYFLVYQ